MVNLLQQTILFTVPLILVALAGVFAERSGIINLALEGIMIIGAFGGVLFIRGMQNAGFPRELGQLLLILGLIVTAIVGAFFSLLLSFSAIKMKADQTIGGTALNLLAPAIALFIINVVFLDSRLTINGDAPSWFMLGRGDLESLGFIGDILFRKFYITTYIGIAIYVILSVILYKTKFGLRLRACGEHPQAADSVGINVYKMRYIGTTISGALAGMGGYIYSVTTANAVADGSVAGFGFLALAVMIFGNWKPLNIAIAGTIFGLFKCLSAVSAQIPFLNNLGISTYFYNMLPYIITLVILAFTSKKSMAPKAEGIPYDKGQR